MQFNSGTTVVSFTGWTNATGTGDSTGGNPPIYFDDRYEPDPDDPASYAAKPHYFTDWMNHLEAMMRKFHPPRPIRVTLKPVRKPPATRRAFRRKAPYP